MSSHDCDPVLLHFSPGSINKRAFIVPTTLKVDEVLSVSASPPSPPPIPGTLPWNPGATMVEVKENSPPKLHCSVSRCSVVMFIISGVFEGRKEATAA